MKKLIIILIFVIFPLMISCIRVPPGCKVVDGCIECINGYSYNITEDWEKVRLLRERSL